MAVQCSGVHKKASKLQESFLYIQYNLLCIIPPRKKCELLRAHKYVIMAFYTNPCHSTDGVP